MKKLYFITILLALVLGSSFTFAKDKSTVETDDLINSIKINIQKSLEAEPLNERKKYNLYSLAARELMEYRYYEESLKYYELSIKSKLDKGMEEAYYNVLFIKYQLKKDVDELVKALEELEHYLIKSESIEKYSYVLSSWKLMLVNNTNAELTLSNSLFAPLVSQNNIESLVKEKKFAQALQLLPENLSQANINFQIQSDILRTIVFGRTQKLYCDEKLKKYPNSFAYTMQICKFLKDSESVAISFIESRVRKESPKRLYWVEAMKEIK
jgi:hypothetical protein